MAVVLNEDGDAAAFARCAYTPEEVVSLRDEASLLFRLREVDGLRSSIPEASSPVPVGDASVMYMRGGQRLLRGPNRLDPRHIAFNQALSVVDPGECPVSECDLVQSALEVVGLERLDDRDRRTGEVLLACLSERHMGTCRQHRDFAPWNTGVTGDGILYVYDWEYSLSGYPATHDLIHFACIRAVLRGVDPRTISEHARRAWGLCQSRQKPGFEEALSLWLLDLWALYAAAWVKSPVGSRSVLEWLAGYTERRDGRQ